MVFKNGIEIVAEIMDETGNAFPELPQPEVDQITAFVAARVMAKVSEEMKARIAFAQACAAIFDGIVAEYAVVFGR